MVDREMTTSFSGGRKEQKLARFDLLPPDALRQVAEHYGKGAKKYAQRNWELGYEWSKAFGAMMRHAWAFWGGEDIDPETGSHHLAAVVFHCFSLLTWADTHVEFDDRPGQETTNAIEYSFIKGGNPSDQSRFYADDPSLHAAAAEAFGDGWEHDVAKRVHKAREETP